jgi:putative phosphoesterase
MLIGILSDTHNNTANLQAALDALRSRGIDTLFHLGDLTAPETAALMNGFRVIHVSGNGDFLTGEIRRVLLELNPLNFSGLVFEGDLDGMRVAATHGHLTGKVQELVDSGNYDYVLRGHSHRRQEYRQGATTVINPGALGGLHVQERSYCVLDTETKKADFLFLK